MVLKRRFRKLGKDRRDKIAPPTPLRCDASSIRKAIIASFYLAIALAAISSPLYSVLLLLFIISVRRSTIFLTNRDDLVAPRAHAHLVRFVIG